jgi:hypothetical protein
MPTTLIAAALIAASALTSTILSAQGHDQTRPATTPTTTEKPVATLADFAWLTGTWRGKLANMNTAAELTFLPTDGDTKLGVMHLTDGSKVILVELIALVETPKGMELRFRHFSSALVAYEPTFKQLLLLKEHDANHDTFENTFAYDSTLMSTQPRMAQWIRRGRDELVAHSDIIGDDKKPAVIEVIYRRVP